MKELLPNEIPEISWMKKRPSKIYAMGEVGLLEERKIAIVGSRRPNGYTKSSVMQLAAALARRKTVVVSGAAMGVDALAHRGAGAARTIAVMPCGLHHRYPAVNASMIGQIEREGLVVSQFDPDFKARPWSFVVRNELVVALGEVLVVAQADRESGTMRSVAFAKAMGKEIFVLPHRLGESEGTNDLLAAKEAEAIYDIDAFAERFGEVAQGNEREDAFIAFCKNSPTWEEAAKRFGERLFEAELEGIVALREGRVIVI